MYTNKPDTNKTVLLLGKSQYGSAGRNPHHDELFLKTALGKILSKMDAHKGLTESQINELKTAFSMLDKNKDGRVNLSEMKTMLSNLGICMEDCVVEALIQQASERDDGLVSEEEFLGWMASQGEIRGQEDDIMQDLLAAFRVFDKDGNGFITRDELKIAMDLIGESVTETQLDEMLKASDIDHDGRINYEEFVKILL